MAEDKALVVQETGEMVEQSEWSRSDIELIKEQVAREATDQELRYFLMVCTATGLDPRLKQIYFIKRWDSNAGRKVGAVQSSIDGIRSVAEDSGQYAGQDAPILDFPEHDKNRVQPISATVTVYRMVEGERVPFTHTAYWDEYVQLTKDGDPTSFWRKMPKNQLSKCAEAGALRKAFPRKLQKIYVHEEMGQADNQLPAAPSQPAPKGQPKGKPATPSGEIPKPLRSMGSKFGSEDKPSKCKFCGKYHIVEDDLIVQHPTMTDKKGGNVWGAEKCYAATFGEPDPNPDDKTRPQPPDPTREALIKEIPELESELGKLNNEFRPMKAREQIFSSTDITKANDQDLIVYWTSLKSVTGSATRVKP